MIVVDGANVIGSRPDGWWRDRPGAARRLHDAIEAALDAGRVDGPVALVLEGAATRGVPAAGEGALTVIHATASGDDAIVDVVRAATPRRDGPASPADPAGSVTVVTADRELRARCDALGATCRGPAWLLDRL